jgi:thymidine kinase
MSTILYTGGMFCSKTRTLLERAEVSALRERKYAIFYPQSCGNGEENSVYSRAGIRKEAVPVQEILDVYQFASNLDDIFIDEIQFIGITNDEVEDFVRFIKYCERNKKNLYLSGLDLDYRGEPFLITKEIMPYCDKIFKLSAVCMCCHNENAKYSLRLKDGSPCSFNEETLIERHNSEYKYIPVCADCFNKKYSN